jgi:hypothetical protein
MFEPPCITDITSPILETLMFILFVPFLTFLLYLLYHNFFLTFTNVRNLYVTPFTIFAPKAIHSFMHIFGNNPFKELRPQSQCNSICFSCGQSDDDHVFLELNMGLCFDWICYICLII